MTQLPYCCDYYVAHGSMAPEGGIDLLRLHDAMQLGAVGQLERVPDL